MKAKDCGEGGREGGREEGFRKTYLQRMENILESATLPKLVHLTLTRGVQRLPVLVLVPGAGHPEEQEGGREGGREGGEDEFHFFSIHSWRAGPPSSRFHPEERREGIRKKGGREGGREGGMK